MASPLALDEALHLLHSPMSPAALRALGGGGNYGTVSSKQMPPLLTMFLAFAPLPALSEPARAARYPGHTCCAVLRWRRAHTNISGFSMSLIFASMMGLLNTTGGTFSAASFHKIQFV